MPKTNDDVELVKFGTASIVSIVDAFTKIASFENVPDLVAARFVKLP